MSYSATSLLELVHAALADHETPCHINLSSDGASMVVATENGHIIVVSAGDDGKLILVHGDWEITVNGNAQPLDVASAIGYIEYTALHDVDLRVAA